jgi:uncharacterized protein (TIRG00374 family)
MSRGIQILLSVLISAAALWFSLHDVELGSFFSDLARARIAWLVPMIALAAICLWFRALRWRVLLETLGPLGDAPVFYATCIGFMGNMVLPLRAGEAIKPIVVARGGQVGVAAALATVALERLCDMIMLGLFAVVTLFLVPGATAVRERTPMVLMLVAIALALVAVVFRFAGAIEDRLERWTERFPPFLKHVVREGGSGFLRGVRGLAEPRTLISTLALSALVWLCAVGGFAAGALALEINAPLIALGFATTVIVAVAVSVPSAPGFIGVFWVGSEIALDLFGIPKSMGFTFGVLNWLVQMVTICGLGMWSLSRLQLSLRDVRGIADPEAPSAPSSDAA